MAVRQVWVSRRTGIDVGQQSVLHDPANLEIMEVGLRVGGSLVHEVLVVG